MAKIERLSHQLQGIGYSIRINLPKAQKAVIEELVDGQIRGHSSSDVAERIINEWILNNAKSFSNYGINFEEAKLKGYYPVKFDERYIKPPKYCGVHQRWPLKIEMYGLPAYQLDSLAERGMFGGQRRTVAEHILEEWVFHNASEQYAEFLKRS